MCINEGDTVPSFQPWTYWGRENCQCHVCTMVTVTLSGKGLQNPLCGLPFQAFKRYPLIGAFMGLCLPAFLSPTLLVCGIILGQGQPERITRKRMPDCLRQPPALLPLKVDLPPLHQTLPRTRLLELHFVVSFLVGIYSSDLITLPSAINILLSLECNFLFFF